MIYNYSRNDNLANGSVQGLMYNSATAAKFSSGAFNVGANVSFPTGAWIHVVVTHANTYNDIYSHTWVYTNGVFANTYGPEGTVTELIHTNAAFGMARSPAWANWYGGCTLALFRGMNGTATVEWAAADYTNTGGALGPAGNMRARNYEP